jgi:hypothetical protein
MGTPPSVLRDRRRQPWSLPARVVPGGRALLLVGAPTAGGSAAYVLGEEGDSIALWRFAR